MAILSGNVIFESNSINYLSSGDIYGSGYFYSNTSNYNSIASGYFSDSSINSGLVINATYEDYAKNKGSTLVNALFIGNSINEGSVDYAIFSGNSINSGIVTTSGLFIGNSENRGTVIGTALFGGNGSNKDGIVIGGSGYYGIPVTNLSNNSIVGSVFNGNPLVGKYGMASYTQPCFGCHVSINKNGTVVSITAPQPLNYAYAYCWNGSSWNEMGFRLGTAYKAFLNDSGNIISISNPSSSNGSGRLRFHCWNGSSWDRMGLDISGCQSFSSNFSMNCIGDKVVVFSNESVKYPDCMTYGALKVYCWNNSSWNQIGNTIKGTCHTECLGDSLAMNYSGNIFAASSHLCIRDSGQINVLSQNGKVRVFYWNNNDWTQMGSDIDGENGEKAGYSIDLNSVGDKLFIGAPSYAGGGRVKVYCWDGSSWNKIGTEIYGSSSGKLGSSISANGIGNKFAVSSTHLICDYPGIYSVCQGEVRVYSWNNFNWVQSVQTITGTGHIISGNITRNEFGKSISMNENGTHLAIGAPGTSTGFDYFKNGAAGVYYLN